MKKEKKIILIILIIIFIFTTILAIYLSSRPNDPNKGNNTGSSNNSPSTNEISKIFTRINDYEIFFSIQNAINESSKLTESYIAKEIYTNNDDLVTYYFIGGALLETNMSDDTINYTKNKNYLMIVNNDYYELLELNSDITDLQQYANEYDVKYREINSNKKLAIKSISLENIITIYLEYFKYMLFLDTEVAYNMLHDIAKENYNNYNDFNKEKEEIYNMISSKIFGYNEKEDGNKIYYIEDDNRNKIVIYENNIMDFKISY